MVATRSAGTVNGLRQWQQRLVAKRQPKGAQISLSQRHIFVLPSAFALAFFMALLLILLVGIHYQHSLAYALCFLLLSVFCIALLHSFRNLNGLTLSAEASPPVFAGQNASFRLRLSSNRQAHQSIAIGFNPQTLQIQDVPAQGSTALTLDYPATHRGWLKAPRLLVESQFPLGLWRVWSWLDCEQRVLVYPRPLDVDYSLANVPVDKSEGEQSRSLGVDDFQGQRRFAPGDSLKRLNWKAYSRERGLFIKEFGSLEGHPTWLDFSALDGDTETRLSILCQQVLELSASGQPFGLRLPGQSLAVESGERQRESCLQALALYGNSA